MSCQACIRAGLVCDALGCATWSKVMDECTGQLQRGSVALKAAKVTLDRETHAREAAEAELRETAGELEKATALLAQPCPWCLCARAPAQPAAPTPASVALGNEFEECPMCDQELPQPAAPEPSAVPSLPTCPECLEDVPLSKAATLSIYAELAARGITARRPGKSMHPEMVALRARAESAEAQLAAIRREAKTHQERGIMTMTTAQVLALLTAPSPGAGGCK